MAFTVSPPASAPADRLKRVLKLRHLLLYGIVLVGAISPPALFGVVQKLSEGHAVTTIALGLVAMAFTAFSYGRMSTLYPNAGSAYTYVGRGLNPHLGFFAGWAMILDYVLVPLICTIYCSLTIGRLIPLPYPVLVVVVAGAMTIVNLRGIRSTITANFVMLAMMCSLVLTFIALATYWLVVHHGWSSLLSTQPFYDPAHFRLAAIATGTSVAALNYGGFDGVTTLAEDVENPRRNVLIATVAVCFITGLFSGTQMYLAQRVFPDYTALSNVETAFMDVSKIVGGIFLFRATAVVLLVASLGSGLTAQAAVARLFFGMGRDGVLPTRFFAHLHPKTNTPVYSILAVGMIAVAGALMLKYEQAAELINFGAFLAFMGVNVAVIRQFYFRQAEGGKRRLGADMIVPALGALSSLAIWISLPNSAKIMGAIWFVAGVIYDGVQTNGFRRAPAMIDFGE